MTERHEKTSGNADPTADSRSPQETVLVTGGSGFLGGWAVVELLRCLVGEANRNWDSILPVAQLAYNSSVNRSINASPFEVMHGYTPRKPLDLLPMSLHVRIFEFPEAFAQHIHDLHSEIRKNIQKSNSQYKIHADTHRHHAEF